MVSSNPIECLLGSLHLSEGQRGLIRQALEAMVRERAAGAIAARLTNPVNIGIGTK